MKLLKEAAVRALDGLIYEEPLVSDYTIRFEHMITTDDFALFKAVGGGRVFKVTVEVEEL